MSPTRSFTRAITDENPLKNFGNWTKIGQGLAFVIAALVIWFLFVHRLGDRDLWSSHEARSGMNARTILDGGLWWLPGRTNDLPDVQKPPMYYWMVALFSGESSQVSAWTIRLPSTLGALVCIFSVYFIGRILADSQTGFLSTLILATAIHFVWSSRIGRIDMPLAGAVTAYFLFALRYALHLGTWDLLAASLMVAISILLKGPVGLVLCGLSALAAWLPLARNVPVFLGLGLTGFLGLFWAIPWFGAAHLATDGEFSRLFFIEHNLDRGLGSGRLRSHPIWFYPIQFLWDFQPWTTILPITFIVFFLESKNITIPIFIATKNPSLYQFIFILSFLSLSSFKRADYLLPAYPSAAILIGTYLNILFKGNFEGQKKWSITGPLTLGIMTTFLVFAWLLYLDIPSKESTRMAKVWAQQTGKLIGDSESIIFFAEEAHSLAFHLNRPHEVIGSPEELSCFLKPDSPIWVFTNPNVIDLWPSGPPGTAWEVVSSNIDPHDGRNPHKPLVLLKAFPVSKVR